MSKKQLEEIKHYYREMNSFDPGTQSDINWLIEQAERVQELEEKYYNLKESAYETQMDFLDANKYRNIYKEQNKRYREALEEIMKIQENHEWNLYGLAYGIAERTLFELEGEE